MHICCTSVRALLQTALSPLPAQCCMDGNGLFQNKSSRHDAGEIMVSAMGDAEGQPKGGFVLLDEDFKVQSQPGAPQ